MGNASTSPPGSTASTGDAEKANIDCVEGTVENISNGMNTKLVEAGDYVLIKQKKRKSGSPVVS